MSITPETIDRLLELNAPNISEHEGLEFTDKPLHVILPPSDDFVMTSTLGGLVDLIKAGFESVNAEEVMFHISEPTKVYIVDRTTDKFGRRKIYAFAQFPKSVTPFKFGAWHDPENFIVGVQSGFQRTFVDGQSLIGDLDYVVKMASNISAEATTTNQDDGISQNVVLKQGIALKAEATLKSRVMLAPYRTFNEIDQVLSEFVFRAKTDGGRTLLALFEADGGRWQINAANAIAEWLTPNVSPIPVIK